MKRVNINYIGVLPEPKDWLIFGYFQYVAESHPAAIRAALAAFAGEPAASSKAGFDEWVKRSFSTPESRAESRLVTHPVIYCDLSGHRTQYSVLLDARRSEAIVWHWEQRIFRGGFAEFAAWLTEPKRARPAPEEPGQRLGGLR